MSAAKGMLLGLEALALIVVLVSAIMRYAPERLMREPPLGTVLLPIGVILLAMVFTEVLTRRVAPSGLESN